MLGIPIEQVTNWLTTSSMAIFEASLRIFITFLIGYIGIKAIRLAITHLKTLLIKASEDTETVPGMVQKRITTLTGLLQTLTFSVVWAIVIIMALEQLGLDITPVLASAGILGLAVGFGAQNLVRDVISGFFIILENQIRVGDVAIVNGTGGLVEKISFRTITLRDLSGVVHVFPNGTITTLSNMTKGWSGYVIDVGVAYKEDTDHVSQVMVSVAEELRQDPDFGPKIIEPIEILGVDQFGPSEVVIKARLKTLPIEQWGVGREYRRRLKKAFDAKGIEIPFPHRTLYMGTASPPFVVQNAMASSPTT
jgi:small conductance mechanosensitive channel